MRKFIIAAAIAVGALSAAPTLSIAAPVASHGLLAAPSDIDAAQYYRRDRYDRYDDRRRERRFERRSERRFGGPPPFARAYGRRSQERFYRY